MQCSLRHAEPGSWRARTALNDRLCGASFAPVNVCCGAVELVTSKTGRSVHAKLKGCCRR